MTDITQSDVDNSTFATKYKTRFCKLVELQQTIDTLYNKGPSYASLNKSEYEAWNSGMLQLIEEQQNIRGFLANESKKYSVLNDEMLEKAQNNFYIDRIPTIF